MNRNTVKIFANISTSFIYTPLTSDDFKLFLKDNCRYFEKNGLEVIIGVRSTIAESKILKEILKYPFVNWKILATESDFIPTVINSCIIHSVKDHILLLNPFARINSAIFFRLKYHATRYEKAFSTLFSTRRNYRDAQSIESPGIIFMRRENLLQADGIEEFSSWTDSAINLIRRLQRMGLKQIKAFAEIIIKKEDNFIKDSPKISKAEIFYPDHSQAISSNMVKSRCRLIYSWSEASYAHERCMKYLKTFKQSKIKDKNCFTRHYRLIALIQTHNEMRNIPEVLRHLDNYCDGIIMLDDGSTDGTYENAVSEKLLLKVQKRRFEFDDMLNRNILFDLVSFFKVDRIFTMDADERLDSRYDKIFDLLDSPFDIIEFVYVNLWNSKETYRVNYPTSENNDGIFYRKRLFRNIGRSQVILPTKKKLHFNPVPHQENVGRVKILILHHGTLSDENRKNKYNFYLSEDSSKSHFEYVYKSLLETDIVLDKVENINLDKVISFSGRES